MNIITNQTSSTLQEHKHTSDAGKATILATFGTLMATRCTRLPSLLGAMLVSTHSSLISMAPGPAPALAPLPARAETSRRAYEAGSRTLRLRSGSADAEQTAVRLSHRTRLQYLRCFTEG